MPIHEDLAAALRHVPTGAFTFLETRQGRSRTPAGLGGAMRRWCDAAGLPNCTSHGLRKAIARRLAEAGATPSQIGSVLGDKTLAMAALYTAGANRAITADAGFEKLAEAGQKVANLSKRFAKKDSNSLKDKE